MCHRMRASARASGTDIGDHETRISMHAVFKLQELRELVMEVQSLVQGLPRIPDEYPIEEIRTGMGATEQKSRVGCGAFKQQIPFLIQRIGIIAAHPIHMIQQNE